jgi:hypothetical protein
LVVVVFGVSQALHFLDQVDDIILVGLQLIGKQDLQVNLLLDQVHGLTVLLLMAITSL